MKSGGKTLDVLSGTRLRGQITLSKEKLESLRADIDTCKMLAKVKCKAPAPLGTLDSMSLQCKAAFIKRLYAGTVSGKTVFRGSAPNIMRMSYGRVQTYLSHVKSVLAGVAKEQAAPQPPARPVTPATPPATPADTKPEENAKLKEAIKEAAYNAIINDHCGSESSPGSVAVGSGKTCKDMAPGDGNASALQKILKQVKFSEMKDDLKTKVVAEFKKEIAKDTGLQAKYGSMDADALASKMWTAVGFGTEEPEAVTPRPRPKKEKETEKKTEKKDGELGRLIILGAVGFGVNGLKLETSMPEPGTEPNKSEVWQINFDAGAKYRISKNVYIGGQIGGWYNKFKRFDTDPAIGKTSPGGSMWGIHGGPAVAYMPHPKVMIDAALMIGSHQATKMNMGALGQGIKVKNAHLAFELGVKYLFSRYVWAGVAMQAIVGLGEAFGQDIASVKYPGSTGFSKLTGIQGMLKLGFSFDAL